ncbi:hypothetical protein [Synechococcus sp. PCC 6312]|uniref:AOC03_06830 family ribosome hibernation factor n=1 Tax=Synechococcus sp. (strain ATCC 27167 / PCC 6312) TaxID=195253 RepID=UPI00029F170C|nr:hypothetical protein [Synechococcus sp. PCC 6312]AFY61751.1 hypothetical protein Syn6312_2660 [Synechococcus sp. PCC 6312]
MITRQDLLHLQSLTHVPALSILLPTHRVSPDNKQDPIRVKNLVSEAVDRLKAEFSQRELEPLLNHLDTLVSEIDYPHTLDGLALYVSHDFAKLYYLPFTIPERVVIDKTFATRDLVYALHRSLRYWVLLLSQASTRLLAGTGETLEEVSDANFAMEMTGPGATAPIPTLADSSYLDDRHRRFFQQVDSALTDYAQGEELPLVLGGVDRQVAFFQEVSQYTSFIAGVIRGNFDRVPAHEVLTQAWPLIQSVRESQQNQTLDELGQAAGAQNVVSMIEEIWNMAQAGRGKLLLVEKNYHVPAIVTESGQLQLVESPGGVDVMDDAVDEIIELVLAKGGKVILVEDGALSLYQSIALILRF